MNKGVPMEIETKCKIIEEFVREYFLKDIFVDDEEVQDFIAYNNLGIPLAQSVSYKLATPTPEGFSLIEETRNFFCSVFNVDSEGEYEDLDEFLESEED
jgi:hypothetical protein